MLDMFQKQELVKKYGYNTISYQALMQGLECYTDNEIEGFIAYKIMLQKIKSAGGKKDFFSLKIPYKTKSRVIPSHIKYHSNMVLPCGLRGGDKLIIFRAIKSVLSSLSSILAIKIKKCGIFSYQNISILTPRKISKTLLSDFGTKLA